MTKRAIPLISYIFVTTIACLSVPGPARAGVIMANIGEYNGPSNFDFNPADYPLSSVTIGTFSFSIPAGQLVASASISGTFGNNDVDSTTALSDYFVKNGAIQVAGCDSQTANCFTGVTGVPTAWSYNFTSGNLTALAPAFAAGSLDFSVIQNFAVTVQTGVTTLTINTVSAVPEPASIWMLCGAFAGLVWRRCRKA